MIKVIAFDLIGVLASERNIELTDIEDKLERKFGPNKSDIEYLEFAKTITDDPEIIDITKNIINKLYYLKDNDLFDKINKKYNDIKILVATNHVSYIKEFIINNYNINSEDIIISAEIGKIKPNSDFYEEVIKKSGYLPNQILFVDDNQENVNGALESGMNSIKINHGDDVFEKVLNFLDNFN